MVKMMMHNDACDDAYDYDAGYDGPHTVSSLLLLIDSKRLDTLTPGCRMHCLASSERPSALGGRK